MLYKISKLYFIVSIAIIGSTVIAVLFSYKNLQEFCICASNKLAYAWILLGSTIFFSIVCLLIGIIKEDRPLSSFNDKVILFGTIIQSICFLSAIVFIILFAAKIINVI